MSPPLPPPQGAARVVICDYAARELCLALDDIGLLVLNTEGTGMDAAGLVRTIREKTPGLPVLHLGLKPLLGMPADVEHLHEGAGAVRVLEVVESLIKPCRSQPVPGKSGA